MFSTQLAPTASGAPLYRLLVKSVLVATVLAITLGGFAQSAQAAPVAGACTLWASPTGNDAANGSAAAPFRTFKRLADALVPGSVGCLRAGTYAPPPNTDGVTLLRGGTTAAPATLRPAPGESVTIDGRLDIRPTAHDLVIAGLRLNGISPLGKETSSVTVDAHRVSLIGNDITAPTRICVAAGYSQIVTGLVIEGNRIHHCGDGAPRARQEHGVYLEQTRGAVIRHNVIDHNNTRGINLYYDADASVIENNVIDANQVGINLGSKLAGGVAYRSEGNVIRNNLITNNWALHLESYYDEVAPVAGDLGNVVGANCFFGTDRAKLYNKLEGFRFEATNRWVDPLYNGQPTGDYRLQPSSPCIGKGLRASITPVRIRSITAGSAIVAAAITPHRMTTRYFARVRRCSDSTCNSVGSWTFTGSSQVVGVLDSIVTKTLTGLSPNTTYQYQWVAHQALLPASNPSALVLGSLTAFRTAAG
jgi:parallel beta-helix repeat protein